MELPECPVCLQSYDGDATTPRVLSCGHSACELCLSQLPNPFPHAVRCPSCTQLVKLPLPPLGPSGLPKNIDLLRFSSSLLPQNPNPPKPTKATKPQIEQSILRDGSVQFMPSLWSPEFYSNWKTWVVPSDAVSVESDGGGDGFYLALCGTLARSSGYLESPIRCSMKENQKVSLVRIGFALHDSDSKFSYSYICNVMRVLYGLNESERDELGLILRASWSRSLRVCKAYGFWYNSGDRCLYLVCERFEVGLTEKLGDLTNGFDGGDQNSLSKSNFAIIGMELCESLIGLQCEGLITGCLPLSCCNIDEFGHLCVDLNEILATGRRIRRIVFNAVKGKRKVDNKDLKVSIVDDVLEAYAFVCPELLLELLRKDGIEFGHEKTRSLVGYGSDVWSLACVLLWLLIGRPFALELSNYLLSLMQKTSDDDEKDLYSCWKEKVCTLLKSKAGPEFESVQEMLCNCLHFDLESRPVSIDLWKCIRELIIEPKLDIFAGQMQEIVEENTSQCLVLGELCQIPKEANEQQEKRVIDGLREEDHNGGEDVDRTGEVRSEKDLVQGLSGGGDVKCKDLKGHLDCITGLAVGGGFLFSSSFDKTVRVWSLQDFTHVHSFRGHENRVMAVVFVNEEQPLCISGDNGGGIFVWGISIPFEEEPIKKWSEEKDWRYSGIHALATSGTHYLYTGSGDKSIKAWSLKDYTLSCTMNGHRSVVSALAVDNGVLYSGSWDGTVRLWCLSDHSPLTVLGEDALGNVTSVLSLAVDGQLLVVAQENGSVKIWRNDVLVKTAESHKGAIFSVGMEGSRLFTGGWDKIVNVQEVSGNSFGVDAVPIGAIACDSVVTALLYWQGKLFVGHADRSIKVHYCGS